MGDQREHRLAVTMGYVPIGSGMERLRLTIRCIACGVTDGWDLNMYRYCPAERIEVLVPGTAVEASEEVKHALALATLHILGKERTGDQ